MHKSPKHNMLIACSLKRTHLHESHSWETLSTIRKTGAMLKRNTNIKQIDVMFDKTYTFYTSNHICVCERRVNGTSKHNMHTKHTDLKTTKRILTQKKKKSFTFFNRAEKRKKLSFASTYFNTRNYYVHASWENID